MKIRLTDELKKLVEDAARSANRTLNAEVVSRLQQSFEAGDPEQVTALRREVELLGQANRALEPMLAALAKISTRLENFIPEETRAEHPEIKLWMEIATQIHDGPTTARALDLAPLLGFYGPEEQLKAFDEIQAKFPHLHPENRKPPPLTPETSERVTSKPRKVK